MPRLSKHSLPLALTAALLALAGAFSACGDGSDSNDEAAGIVHRLLIAALAQDPEALESFPGELPPDLPAEVPIYPGSDVIVSSRELRAPEDAIEEPAAGDPVIALYLILLGTPDEATEVFAFYQEALDEDPWQIENAVATSELQRIDFSLITDPDVTGTLDVSRGREDDATTVIISLQDSGAEQIEAPAFELPEGLPVPSQWPADVPIYEGATITSSAFVRQPGQESMLLTFLTEAAQEDVVEFYRSAFAELGWDVEDLESEGLEERFRFIDSAGGLTGDLRADRSGDDRELTEVVISIQQESGREPGGTPAGDETPDDGVTPATPGIEG